MTALYDFNTTRTKREAFSDAIAARVDASLEAQQERPRNYLGASQIGDECQRRIQYEMRAAPGAPVPGRIRRIFERGNRLEGEVAAWLNGAGFTVRTQKPEGGQFGFHQAHGRFRGHVDGVVVDGPTDVGLEYPCLWENKILGAKGWAALARNGLAKAHPKYADQVALYQFYLGLTAPALFTAVNADTMEIWTERVEFDAARAQTTSDRAVNVILATDAGELLPRVSADPGAFPCPWCRFKSTCWA